MVSYERDQEAGGEYHPMNLFLVNMAAIGRVLPRVPAMSLESDLGTGTWYGITGGVSLDAVLKLKAVVLTEIISAHILFVRHDCGFPWEMGWRCSESIAVLDLDLDIIEDIGALGLRLQFR